VEVKLVYQTVFTSGFVSSTSNQTMKLFINLAI